MQATKYFRILALVAMLAVSIGPSSAAIAADPSTSVNTSAVVVPSSGGSASANDLAVIECKWELPDMDPALVGGYPQADIQYYAGVTASANNDDDTAALAFVGTGSQGTLATGNTAAVGLGSVGTPCKLPTVVTASSKPSQADWAREVITVQPLAHDCWPSPSTLCELRRVQVWAAIDAPVNGQTITDVNWDIYHPDGTLKTEKHATATNVPGVTNKISQADCNSALNSGTTLGNSTVVGSMFGAASGGTGQIAATAIDNPTNGLLYWCTQTKGLYFAEFQISKHQPCGEYVIKVNAVTNTGATSSLNNTILVRCFNNVVLDFTAVDFGTITPGSDKKINGDVVFETPAGIATGFSAAGPPVTVMATVRNTGNSSALYRIRFTALTNSNPPCSNGVGVAPTNCTLAQANTPDQITSFDACFAAAASYDPNVDGKGLSVKTLYCNNSIAASTSVTTPLWPQAGPPPESGSINDQTLCANRVGKLDLSIHPQSGIQAGTYTGGKVFVIATSTGFAAGARPCRTDNGHVDNTTILGSDTLGYPGKPIGDGITP